MHWRNRLGASAAAGAFLLLSARQALADGGINPVTPDSLSQKVIQLAQTILQPLGGAIIFIAVCIIAVKLIATHGKPEKRADALISILYVGAGGLLLGGAMLIAGFIIGTGQQLGQ